MKTTYIKAAGMRLTYFHDTQSLQVQDERGTFEYDERRMREIAGRYYGLTRIDKPLALLFWTDCKNGDASGWETREEYWDTITVPAHWVAPFFNGDPIDGDPIEDTGADENEVEAFRAFCETYRTRDLEFLLDRGAYFSTRHAGTHGGVLPCDCVDARLLNNPHTHGGDK